MRAKISEGNFILMSIHIVLPHEVLRDPYFLYDIDKGNVAIRNRYVTKSDIGKKVTVEGTITDVTYNTIHVNDVLVNSNTLWWKGPII